MIGIKNSWNQSKKWKYSDYVISTCTVFTIDNKFIFIADIPIK